MERQNTAARRPNLGSDRLSPVLCFGAITIGIIALTGYVLGNASIAALSANGKPVSVVTALALIVLGAGLLALRSPAPAGVSTARHAALAVVVLAAADLLSAALSLNNEPWQSWAARGSVYVHPYPITSILILALGSALFFVTTRSDFAGHLIASAVLLACIVFFYAYGLKLHAFLDPLGRVAPVLATTVGLALISVAELLARPRGWVVPLLSRTSTGLMTRVLLLATFIVPFLANTLRDLIAGVRWLNPEMNHAVVVDVVEVFFSAAIVLGAGVILHKRERDRLRLAAIVDSSDDAIIGTSSAGVIETWNAGAERMYGHTKAEAVGRPVTMIAPLERNDEAPLLLERIRHGERLDPFETIRVTKDGRRIDVWLRVSPILDDEGSLVGASSVAQDITDWKKSEEEIGRLAEQYATLLATSSDGFWLADLEGRLLDVNDAYCRMSGYSRQELLKLGIGDLDAIETPEETASRIRDIAESGVAHFETKHRTKDGRLIDVEISVSLWRKAGRMLMFSRDITQRKQEQEALRRSEERVQLAQRAAGIGHFSWDIPSGITTRSDEMSLLYGLPPGSLSGKHEDWRERIFPDDLPEVDAEIRKSLISGELSQYFRVVWPDASIHWLLARGKVFFSADGKPLRMVGVNMDITERMRTEEALRKSEAHYRTLVENLPQKVMLKDRHSVYVSVNAAHARDLGIDPKAVAGKTDHDFFPGDLAEKYRADDARVMKAGVTEAFDEEYVEGGQRRFIHTVKTPVRDPQGNVTNILVILWDVTEKKLAEEQLQKTMAELEESNRNLEKSEAALREGQRVAHIGHWEWSTVTGATTWSDEIYRILGIPIGSVAPSHKFFFDLIETNDRCRLEEMIASAVASSGADSEVDIDLRITTPAGAALVVSERLFVNRNDDGNVVGFHGTCQDITERVRTAEALTKSEAALKEAQRAAHVGHWAWSAVTGAAEWSDEVYRILEIPKGSAPASLALYLSLVDPADRRILEEEMARVVGSGEGGADRDLAFDARITTQAGNARILSQRVIADPDASGNVVGFHGTIQDITRRVATEQALRDSEAALAEAQQIAHVGSAIVHMESGEIDASDEYFRIFDLEPRTGTPIKVFLGRIHEEDRGAVKDALKASASSGTFDAKFRIACRDGSIRFAHGIARRRLGNERNFGLLGTIEDVTERKLAEEALRQQADGLERSNADLERFNRAAVGRELRMIELKQQINDLYAQSGRRAPYVLPEEYGAGKETS